MLDIRRYTSQPTITGGSERRVQDCDDTAGAAAGSRFPLTPVPRQILEYMWSTLSGSFDCEQYMADLIKKTPPPLLAAYTAAVAYDCDGAAEKAERAARTLI